MKRKIRQVNYLYNIIWVLIMYLITLPHENQTMRYFPLGSIVIALISKKKKSEPQSNSFGINQARSCHIMEIIRHLCHL